MFDPSTIVTLRIVFDDDFLSTFLVDNIRVFKDVIDIRREFPDAAGEPSRYYLLRIRASSFIMVRRTLLDIHGVRSVSDPLPEGALLAAAAARGIHSFVN